MGRILAAAVLALALAVIGLSAPLSAPLAAADQGDKARFRAAYSRYQQAVEARDAKAAVAAAGEALRLGAGVLPDDGEAMASLNVNYGMALVDATRFSEAMAPLRDGIRRLEKLHGKKDESLIAPLWALADAYKGDGARMDKGIAYLRRIMKLVEKTRGRNDVLFAEINQSLGEALYGSQMQQKRARGYLKTAYDTFDRLYDGPAYKTGLSAFWLGKSAVQQQNFKAAEAYFLDALGLFEKTSPAGHPLQLMAHTFLISLYENRGKSDLADAHCQAISLARRATGVDGFRPLFRTSPVYPRSALEKQQEGFVDLEFSVTTRGRVTGPVVTNSEGGRIFERAALDAIKSFRYAPAVQNGELVTTDNVQIRIKFVVTDKPT